MVSYYDIEKLLLNLLEVKEKQTQAWSLDQQHPSRMNRLEYESWTRTLDAELGATCVALVSVINT